MDEIDVDDVPEIPMSSNEGPIPIAEPERTQTEPEYEYQARGRAIKEPLNQILKRASQGYDYAQKMEDYNKQKSEFDTNYKAYQEIDKYAQTNPDWWNHVQSQYQQRSNLNGQQNQQAPQEGVGDDPKLAPIMSELQELKRFRDEIKSRELNETREKEDQALKSEIESIRKDYTNLDFSTPGEDGKNLEAKVLEYAVQNGINSFKTAFRDFYHDKLLERARSEGKELAVKEVQKKTKLGLLGESPTPKREVSQASDLKNKSYDALLNETLEELGLLGSSLRG